MKARYIVMSEDGASRAGAIALMQSHVSVGNDFRLDCFEATTPATVERHMNSCGVKWTYPWEGEPECRYVRPDLSVTLRPYKTTNRAARMACFMSHYRLWLKCLALQEPLLILEDDALFVRNLDPEPLLGTFSVLGINDPRGATRRANVYHSQTQDAAHVTQTGSGAVTDVPWIDAPEIPQGLAGASAYLITPIGAAKAIDLTRELGAWPNDALLCKQNMPGQLGQTLTYFTKVQGRPSSLS